MKQHLLVGGSIAALALIAACGDDTAPITATADPRTDRTFSIPPPNEATSRIHPVDAPTGEITPIVITVANVETSIRGEWLSVGHMEQVI